jgi:hypothetical protein
MVQVADLIQNNAHLERELRNLKAKCEEIDKTIPTDSTNISS